MQQFQQEPRRTLPGSPTPKDPFEPHMPEVNVIEDMDALFARARLPPPNQSRKQVAVVTPRRSIVFLPGLGVGRVGKLFSGRGPLDITVVSYTKFEGTEPFGEMIKRIPFLGMLAALTGAGHSVVAFEGHPSAFETGVRAADVLIIDSGMLPFLQIDWPEIAFREMKNNATVLAARFGPADARVQECESAWLEIR